MPCPSCGSNGESVFSAEINIHFPGKEGLDKPTVWVFPQLSICFECGFTQFAMPEAQLRQLWEGDSRMLKKAARTS